MDRPIVTIQEAIAKDLPRYFTGVPCEKGGHLSERYTNDTRCIECTKERNRRHSEKRKAVTAGKTQVDKRAKVYMMGKLVRSR